MNAHNIELPRLPSIQRWDYVGDSYLIGQREGGELVDYEDHIEAMKTYALTAIEADRKRRGEPIRLQHMAVSDERGLRWMSGRKHPPGVSAVELYAMPDFGRAPDAFYTTPQPTEPVVKESLTVAEPVRAYCPADVCLAAGSIWTMRNARIPSCSPTSFLSATFQGQEAMTPTTFLRPICETITEGEGLSGSQPPNP